MKHANTPLISKAHIANVFITVANEAINEINFAPKYDKAMFTLRTLLSLAIKLHETELVDKINSLITDVREKQFTYTQKQNGTKSS